MAEDGVPRVEVATELTSDFSDFSEIVDTEGKLPVELVFGLVGPTGVDLTKVCDSLCAQLKAVGYVSHIVHLSQLILPFLGKDIEFKNEYQRINALMDEGSSLRRDTKQADIIARLGVAKIKAIRKSISNHEFLPCDAAKTAYIVRSFKRPEEVSLYRDIYGKAFNLISVYAPRAFRVDYLSKRLRGAESLEGESAEGLALRLIKKDFDEEGKLGQQVSRTFPLADFFVTNESRNEIDRQLRRLIRLAFGDPYISPTRDEQGMFFAQAAALRSLDLSRQVGAAICSTDGDVLATGCNEVPKFGGGLYWEGDDGVARDFEAGYDSNMTIKSELIEDAVRRMQANGWLSDTLRKASEKDLASSSLFGEKPFFRDSRLFDVIEFGRAVHAEMAAITQAARSGIPIKGSKMYSTTFPCHICARHIVSSGVEEVFFIEPYEKSRTGELFGDSISVEPHEPSPKRCNFRAFVGVSPRRYFDFFQLTGDRKNKDGTILDPNAIAERPKIRRMVMTYLMVETVVVTDTKSPAGLDKGVCDEGQGS